MTWNSYSCCCDWGFEAVYPRPINEDTPWSGHQADKLYLQSGQFDSTLKFSISVSAVSSLPSGISWDGVDTPWTGDRASDGNDERLWLQSGQFTSTIKDSLDVNTWKPLSGSDSLSVSWDGTNTPWTMGTETSVVADNSKLFLQSGQFTSTLKTSLIVDGSDSTVRCWGITWDGTDTPWIDDTHKKFVLQSGQFASTIKTSQIVAVFISDIEWDGANTSTVNLSNSRLTLYSGKFTTTVKDSVSVSSVDTGPLGISSNILTGRI